MPIATGISDRLVIPAIQPRSAIGPSSTPGADARIVMANSEIVRPTAAPNQRSCVRATTVARR